jgi:hypothetical protein
MSFVKWEKVFALAPEFFLVVETQIRTQEAAGAIETSRVVHFTENGVVPN